MKTPRKPYFFAFSFGGAFVVLATLIVSIFFAQGQSTHAAAPACGFFESSDTFHRPNQQYWGTSTPGWRWGGDANVSKAFSISNNTGIIAGGTGVTYNALGHCTVSKEGRVWVTGALSVYNGGNFGAILRWKDSNNWYKAFINGTKLVIEKRLNGQFTHLKEVAFNAQPNVFYQIDFQVGGSGFVAFVYADSNRDGDPEGGPLAEATASDSSITSGLVGLRVDIPGNTVAKIGRFRGDAND